MHSEGMNCYWLCQNGSYKPQEDEYNFRWVNKSIGNHSGGGGIDCFFKNENKKRWIKQTSSQISYTYGGARGVMVIDVGKGHGGTSSNLDEADCISYSANTLVKGMNPIILPSAMSK